MGEAAKESFAQQQLLCEVKSGSKLFTFHSSLFHFLYEVCTALNLLKHSLSQSA